MQERRRQWIRIGASLALAVALLAYFLSRAPLGEVGAALGKIDVVWFIASVATALLAYLLRALRWGVILAPLGSARATALFGATAAGFATSTVLPARAGELVRPLLLSARTGLPAAGTLASILTERLADLATILVLFAVGVFAAGPGLAPESVPALRDAALLSAAGLLAGTAFVLLLLRRREGAVARLVRIAPERFRARGSTFLHHLLDGLEAIRRPATLARLAAWSAVTWLVIALQVVTLARAFRLSLDLPLVFIFLAVSVIGLAVPTPGGMGGFHAAVQIALTRLFGVDAATATAFALVHHAVCFVPITLIGLGYIGSVGLSLGKVKQLQAPPAPETGG